MREEGPLKILSYPARARCDRRVPSRHNAALKLYYDVQGTGDGVVYSTEITSSCPPELRFDIFEHDMFATISKCFGSKDVKIGEAEYDKVFFIRADDPAQVRRVCDRDMRRRHLELRRVRVSANDGEMKLECGGVVSDYDASLGMLEFAALVAERLR